MMRAHHSSKGLQFTRRATLLTIVLLGGVSPLLAQSVTWVSKGTIPANAVVGGGENGYPLYVCRANYMGGVHPGKLLAGNCNIGYGGKEIVLNNYEILVGSGTWGAPQTGFAGALAAGYENGGPLYLCHANYKGVHPGKVVADNCNIGYGGGEKIFSSYEVFYPAAPSTLQTAQQESSKKIVKFAMPYLECFKTTEHGEDEVYLVVVGKWHDGTTFQRRFPNASDHWDLNDGEGDPPLTDQPLYNLTMNDGDAVDIVVMVMEEDGGTVGGWTSLAGGVLGVVSKPAGSIIASIGQLFNIKDSDDFISAFSVHIENRKGDIFPKFASRDRITSICDPNQYFTACVIDMNGDGSDYRGRFTVE